MTVGLAMTERECRIRHINDVRRGVGVCRRCARGKTLCPHLYPSIPAKAPKKPVQVPVQAVEIPKVPVQAVEGPKIPATPVKARKKSDKAVEILGPGMKQCGKCKKIKPETEFRVMAHGGRGSVCEACETRYKMGPHGLVKPVKEKKSKKRKAPPVNMKRCGTCHVIKPESEFRFSEWTQALVVTCDKCEQRYGFGPYKKRKKGAAGVR